MQKANLLTYFLFVYFYEIEQKLNSTQNKLELIKFQSEEANTDEFLKRYFKNFLSVHNSIKDTEIKKLELQIDSETHQIDTKELFNYQIKNIFLPEELTSIQKQEITKSKKSVYTNPDLYLEISDGITLFYESVELKSTKNDTIPGSSVQQILPFEWVIFIKRNVNSVSVATGFYINSITKKLSFPDRSPRPQVGFKNLVDWNKKYRKEEKKTLFIENNSQINTEKLKLLIDWQDYLASEWLEIIKSDFSKKNEKWFNNALRKFSIKFLEYTENLNEEEKNNLKLKLRNLIK
ncbi:hypothetical protein Fleli_2208 [Bernardetia litoralis DSM 6794]|uniref:Uncharacterized protein n=1 Tax=Bernardetia litoralis (strain ATCC 23117 / DSM 6794 / NBRC 15988 / NCIMB 1366 / Fx l1 / Sio-4) TaxID=880071 RepID=I4AKV2_BERLS|nr:hypothetical protein [Bernardetia litoralis]AFM04587.1 hypothetical protein Fleli_2208 [Bernardetia litoralis DSM 6794]